MRTLFIAVVASCLFSTGTRSNPTDYPSLWFTVDSLTQAGLPRSALDIVQQVYQLASAEKNDPEKVKAIVYRFRLQSEFVENFFAGAIEEIQQEIDSSQTPVTQILQSILGELYAMYWSEEQYRIRERATLLDPTSTDIQTWDPTTLFSHAIAAYRQSLTPEVDLQAIPVAHFVGILSGSPFEKEKPDSMAIYQDRSTLFDFLAHRALDFFTSTHSPVTSSANAFQLDNPYFFSPASKFSQYPLKPTGIRALPGDTYFTPPGTDSLSLSWYAIRVFQALEQFHLNNKNVQPLVLVELERLSYVREHALVSNKDSLFQEALEEAMHTFSFSPASTEIAFALARFLVDAGNTYLPLQSSAHQWDLKKALGLCMKTVERYPDSPGGKNCLALIKEIMAPSLSLHAEYAVIPSREALLLVETKNIPSLHFRLLQASPEKDPTLFNNLNEEEQVKLLNTFPVVAEWSVSLPRTDDFQKHSVEAAIPPLFPGFYLLFASADAGFRSPDVPFCYRSIWSTSISYVSQRTDQGGVDIYLLDRANGIPIPHANVELFSTRYDARANATVDNKIGEQPADKMGFLSIPPPPDHGQYERIYLRIKQKDETFFSEPFYLYPQRDPAERTTEQTRFFTDRAIYRPGQTIYYNGIILERTGDSTSLKTGKSTRVIFTDVNGRKISEQQFTTDNYGAFNGSFIAPDGVLLGNTRISNESGSISVSVEAYKRPSFEVTFDSIDGNYKLEHPLTISGQAVGFASNPIDNATVSYRVTRKTTYPYPYRGGFVDFPFPTENEMEITQGTLTTDANGTFAITFEATPDNSIPITHDPVFRFEVSVRITDLNGETRSAVESIAVGYHSLFLNFKVARELNIREKLELAPITTNLNGKPTPADVIVWVQQLIPPAQPVKTRLWETPDTCLFTRESFYKQFPNDAYMQDDEPARWPVGKTILKKAIRTGNAHVIQLPVPGNLSVHENSPGELMTPGMYKITLEAIDPFGDTIKNIQFITAFDPEGKTPPLPLFNWFVPLTTSGEPGETASFLLGTSEKNQQLVQEVRVKGKLQTRTWIKLSQEQRVISVPITEDCRGNFSVSFIFVRDNRSYQNTRTINVPYTSKELDIVVESFRDHLIPGAVETWTVHLKNNENKGVVARYMTAMYDLSLDQFRSNSWRFDLYQRFYSSNPFEITAGFGQSGAAWKSPFFADPKPVSSSYYLYWFGLNKGNAYRVLSYTMADEKMSSRAHSEFAPLKAGSPDHLVSPELKEVDGTDKEAGQKPNLDDQVKPEIPLFPVRKDFRETAFFYPSMVSDTNGTIQLSFTVPDALTSWKLLGLAYTRDLFHGTLEKELIARKELMVFPNLPRFARQGDTVLLIAKIVNLSDYAITGEASLSLAEALTLQPLNTLVQGRGENLLKEKSFSIPANQSSTVSWTLGIPESRFISLLKYQVVAKTAHFSDGEENVIPIFPNRTMVTETFPLAVRGAGTFDYTFDKLVSSGTTASGTATNYRLTLEFASNPAWYAIQALPALNKIVYKSVPEQFEAFYASAMGAHIANASTRIRQVFESWKTLSPEALLSPLEKNQSYKSALLEETPWVREAENETENRRRLGQFFDMNNLQQQMQQSISRLALMQQPTGGWPWFEGMRENQSVTLTILSGFGRMEQLNIRYNGIEDKVARMLQNGVRFLQRKIVEEYTTLKKHHPKELDNNFLTPLQIKTLYALSFFHEEYDKNLLEARSYFLSQAKTYWGKQELMLQGMIALALNRSGDHETARTILRSLSEKALHSSEFGMYWVTPAGFSWYNAPVERQTLLIEAFDEIEPDTGVIEELKIWLLKQKQTQMWQTKEATVDACFALLHRGTNLLIANPRVDIRLGGRLVNPSQSGDLQPEAGTGYFKISWDGREILPDMGKIQVTKISDGIAWGGLYWQYFENLDNITSHETPLTVKKRLYVEKNTETGPVLVPVTQNNAHSSTDTSFLPLTLGDKLIVRLVVTVDRAMEFVHLKDMRAAGLEPSLLPSFQQGRGNAEGGLSGYRYQDGLGYYQSTTDVATNFFFDYLPKGTWVFEYPLMVNNAGDFSTGIATIQCLYAPEFSACSEGGRLKISK